MNGAVLLPPKASGPPDSDRTPQNIGPNERSRALATRAKLAPASSSSIEQSTSVGNSEPIEVGLSWGQRWRRYLTLVGLALTPTRGPAASNLWATADALSLLDMQIARAQAYELAGHQVNMSRLSQQTRQPRRRDRHHHQPHGRASSGRKPLYGSH